LDKHPAVVAVLIHGRVRHCRTKVTIVEAIDNPCICTRSLWNT